MKKVGDRTTEKVTHSGDVVEGTVVWVHPLHRYYVVEFKCLWDSYRESYYIPREKNLDKPKRATYVDAIAGGTR